MTIRVRTLSAEERTELTRMARSRTLCAGRVKRARLVLLAAEGREGGERPGRPPVYSAGQVGAVIGAALTRPADLGPPFASWTLDRLVAYLGEAKGIATRRSRVGEVLRREGPRWRREETRFGVRV